MNQSIPACGLRPKVASREARASKKASRPSSFAREDIPWSKKRSFVVGKPEGGKKHGARKLPQSVSVHALAV
jgi:hypothetical protein